MPVDPAWLDSLLRMKDLATRETLVVDGVALLLPKANARGRDRHRDWQRRVQSDLMPDSVQADASERTPFRLLYNLTSGARAGQPIATALAGDLAPLADLFRARTLTSSGKKMTLAFHVLAVKAADKSENDARGFTERTLLLLLRDREGRLNEPLLRRLVEAFRRHPSTLDLAQRTLLDRLAPGWTPEQEPTFSLPESAHTPEIPFDVQAATLFQEDLAVVLDAELPPADFFQQLNLLLVVHLGLYQPRLACLLGPQMEELYCQMQDPEGSRIDALVQIVERFEAHHPITGRLWCRAPDPELRPVTLQTEARTSFEAMAQELNHLHFHLLVLGQVRRLAEGWLAHRWGIGREWLQDQLNPDQVRDLAVAVRTPLDLVRRMVDDPDFTTFLHRALTALAVRFVHNQLGESTQTEAFAEIRAAESPLHALQRMYRRYNHQSVSSKSSSRAYRQGVQVVSSLLKQGEQYGLLQSRPRVGPFFEVGPGMLPLLILLAVGADRDKVPVKRLWERLAAYGLSFDPEEQERLLARLRAMGVYERYSDAGEAAYVRNLMTHRVA